MEQQRSLGFSPVVRTAAERGRASAKSVRDEEESAGNEGGPDHDSACGDPEGPSGPASLMVQPKAAPATTVPFVKDEPCDPASPNPATVPLALTTQ